MNMRLLALAVSAATLVLAGAMPAPAEARNGYRGPPPHAPAHGYRAQQGYGEYAWAQVVRVDPLISYDSRPVRRQECWDEPVQAHYERYPSQHSNAGVVLGAIVGGVVGNQFGGGRGRVATTAAGAALGGAVASDMQRNRQYGGQYGSQTVYEQRCRQTTDYMRHERVDGYEVTYRYGGRTYQTITDHHPGDRIQVRVDVMPVY